MNKKILVALSLIGLVIFSSCLKDKTLVGPDADGAITNIIEFKNPGYIISPTTSKLPLYSMTYDLVAADTLYLEVNYGGSETAPQDITVNVKVDTTLLTTYNADQATHYYALPSTKYNLATASAVIKKGERVAKVPVALKPSLFTFDHEYALGFTIESSSYGNVSGNFGKIVVSIGGKNAYDGVYNYKTSAATALLPNRNVTVSLVTIGANTVQLDPGLLGYYGNVVTYTVDPTTFQVTTAMVTLLPIANFPESKYNPATKTFNLKWTSNGGVRTFEETLTYLRPR